MLSGFTTCRFRSRRSSGSILACTRVYRRKDGFLNLELSTIRKRSQTSSKALDSNSKCAAMYSGSGGTCLGHMRIFLLLRAQRRCLLRVGSGRYNGFAIGQKQTFNTKIQTMDITSKRSEIVSVLMAMPLRDLVDVLNDVLSRRFTDVAGRDFEERKLVIAEAYRAHNGDACYSGWELLVLASPTEMGAYVTDSDAAPTQEGGCCGIVLLRYAKNVVCPLCGKSANLT